MWSEPPDCRICFPFTPAGSLYQLCARRVSEILRNKVHRTEEVKDVEFYAFSYYYDLATNVGLIGKGGAGFAMWGPGVWDLGQRARQSHQGGRRAGTCHE